MSVVLWFCGVCVCVCVCVFSEEERLGGGLEGGGEGERAFVDLGSTVLTARSCDFSGPAHPDFGHPRPRSLQECEIFQPMSESVSLPLGRV